MEDDLFAEGRVFGIGTMEKDKVVRIIESVFERIPPEDKLTITLKRNVAFVVPYNATAEVLYVNPMANPDTKMVPIWIVSLPKETFTGKEYECVYTIAHELAHVFLEHAPNGKGETIREIEIAADKQVIVWGFDKELQLSPYSYINGNGLETFGM